MNSTDLPKRVLMTADTVGGVWTYALELAKALEPHGIEVLLATMGGAVTRQQFREVEAVGNIRLSESNYKLEWMDDPWLDLAAAGDWLLELENEFKPDLIHLNGYAHGILPWQAPIIVVGHSCVLSWWRAVRGGDTPAEWNDYREAARAGLHSAHAVIAPSRTMLRALEHHYGVLANTRVIPNGRTFPQMRQPRKEALILVAGRIWDEAKNISALIDIAPELAWPVCMAGETRNPCNDSKAGNSPIRLPGHPRLSPNFLGCLSSAELWNWFGRASIYALPARYEPFGLTPLEAALSGCALVLGDIPSLREIWGETAIFVDTGDRNALKSALEELIASPMLLNEMAQRAQSAARDYTPEKMAEAYLVSYANAIGAARTQKRGSSQKSEPALLQPRSELAVCEL